MSNLKQVCCAVKLKKLHNFKHVATGLALLSEYLRVQLLHSSKHEAEALEVFLMLLISALKAQLKCDLLQEAAITSARSDEFLSQSSLIVTQ